MADTVKKTASHEDRTLAERAKQGDAEAFGALYDRHVARIYRFVFLKIGHAGDAEDLTHETFLAAWRTIGNYESRGTATFTSWLYRIAGNRVIDRYRTEKRGISLDEMMAGGSVPAELVLHGGTNLVNALARKMDIRNVMEALKGLSEDQQNVIIMRYVEDLTPEETGEAIGKSAAAVRLIQHRAIGKLKQLIGEKHEYPIPRRTA